MVRERRKAVMMESMDQYRYERVIIETMRHRIEGTITLARDGYRSRLSDVLNATERDFLSLTDATVRAVDGSDAGAGVTHPFVVVARQQIVLAIPMDPNAGPSTPPPLTAV
ncbi:MAG: hypothetical protein JWN65_2736 [Solirubrobacterales bacterium]|jgi:hypothetical protein|nr:hypothetical protein [Solirubrobacterales bacterium]